MKQFIVINPKSPYFKQIGVDVTSFIDKDNPMLAIRMLFNDGEIVDIFNAEVSDKLDYNFNNWEEEFEDLIIDWNDVTLLKEINTYFIDLCIKYKLINKKVKIKARKGCIQIEKVK